MPQTLKTTYLLASNEPALLANVERVLASSGAEVRIVLSPEAALEAMIGPHAPAAAWIDARLPELDLGRFLATARAEAGGRCPIVLFSDTISDEVKSRLEEGVLNDVLPTTITAGQLAVRLDMLLRADRRERELDHLRDEMARDDRTDRLTGVHSREAILAALFRETDRVQRMKTSLCAILFDIDDFGHWNTELGSAPCDQLLVDVAKRVARLLRSYDLLGRVGKDEFLAGLPGCTVVNAVLLAERIRDEVFGLPFTAGGRAVRLSACFGIAPSNGRSPVVVLREAEEALRLARASGPETIQCAAGLPQASPAPTAFLATDDKFCW
ncbi:GGDEF domain-containing response regulator [Occallatibacter riparius]|uniref:diguanylate cyclase n=1 Tax=Occallatibacter riparius TaxID=1002689 RepID=A0A9J7BUY1_9BACT|nr:diguanylate cyclase [Occallatibacter riparius]UWZ86684.1 diguanylate cyclase [Occallatibacter riparius]